MRTNHYGSTGTMPPIRIFDSRKERDTWEDEKPERHAVKSTQARKTMLDWSLNHTGLCPTGLYNGGYSLSEAPMSVIVRYYNLSTRDLFKSERNMQK